MIRFFSANHFYNFFLILLIGGCIFLSGMIKPLDDLFLVNCTHNSPFSLFVKDITLPAITGLIINFILVMIICFQLLQINARFAFVKERTFLPPYIYLFIVLVLPEMRIFQSVYLAAVFILLAINRIFASYEQPKAILNAFDAAFFTGLASLFYLPAFFFMILIPLSLYFLRLKTIWNEWIATIFGGLLPWIFAVPILFILKPSEFLNFLYQQIHLLHPSYIPDNPVVIAYLSFFLFLIALASIFILKQYHTQKISSRRYYKILFYFFILPLILILFSSVSFEIIVLAAIPVSYLFTNYFISAKRQRLTNLAFGAMMVMVFALQYVL